MTKSIATRERILDRAIRMASAEGLEALSLGRLAEDVGMSKSGLFAHFRSKEELELAVLREAIERFTEIVIRPALVAPRGEPRVRALFERWLAWERHESIPGGCVFVQLAVELHGRPGATRDALATSQRQWLDMLARAAELAIETGDFRSDLDPHLFAFEQYGILLSYYHTKRLLDDAHADARVLAAFETLIASAR